MLSLLLLLSCMLVHAQQKQQDQEQGTDSPAPSTPGTPPLNIHWTAFTPKYAVMPTNIICEDAFISVPQDYYGEYVNASATMTIRVRRYRSQLMMM